MWLRTGASSTAFLVLSLLALVPLVVVSQYNHPQADDFCFVANVRELGLWQFHVNWYQGWTGRYAGLALLGSHALLSDFTGEFAVGSHGMWAYRIFPALLILFLFASLYFFVAELFATRSSRREPLVAATMLLALYFLGMPSMVGGIYWLAASLLYQVANALMLVLCVVIIQSQKAQTTRARLLLILSAHIIVVVIVGLNEVSMLIVDVLLMAALVTKSWPRRRIDGVLLALLVTAALSTAMVVLAPGTSVRLGRHPHSRDLMLTVLASVRQAGTELVPWIIDSPLLLVTVAVVPLAARMGHLRPDSRRYFAVHPMLSISIFATLLVAAWLPGFWSQGAASPGRTRNVIYFFFLIGWFYNVRVLTQHLQEKHGLDVRPLPKYVLILISAGVALHLVGANNIRSVWWDVISGRGAHYDTELRARYGAIERCRSDVCEVDPLKARPAALFFKDITEDDKFWSNVCYARAFDRKAIRLKQSPTTPAPSASIDGSGARRP